MSVQKRVEDMNILVIDDEEKICELIKIFLESTFPFHSVVSAPNAAQAARSSRTKSLTLLLSTT